MERPSKATITGANDIGSISVLIPTCKRPSLLKAALSAVRNQSAVYSIAEVIISENSESSESYSVCSAFPDLPIRYFQHKSPLRVEDHFWWLTQQAYSHWIAPLGDDDMWSRYHL